MIRGIYRMTAGQFRKAIDAGVFGERHVELLGGIPFVMSENPPHILASIRRLVEVRTLPSGKGKQAGYARCDIYQESDHVPVILDGRDVGRFAVAGLLP